jgi:hypothetical protein
LKHNEKRRPAHCPRALNHARAQLALQTKRKKESYRIKKNSAPDGQKMRPANLLAFFIFVFFGCGQPRCAGGWPRKVRRLSRGPRRTGAADKVGYSCRAASSLARMQPRADGGCVTIGRTFTHTAGRWDLLGVRPTPLKISQKLVTEAQRAKTLPASLVDGASVLPAEMRG